MNEETLPEIIGPLLSPILLIKGASITAVGRGVLCPVMVLFMSKTDVCIHGAQNARFCGRGAQ